MLSRLPVELLRLIIREAAPLEYRSSTYKDRRRTLRSRCLVDKRMRAVAQPMLAEVVEALVYTLVPVGGPLPGDKQQSYVLAPSVLREHWSKIAARIRILRVRPRCADQRKYIHFPDESLAFVFFALDCYIFMSDVPLVFVALEELSLCRATLKNPLHSDLFSQRCFPSLRVLALVNVTVTSDQPIVPLTIDGASWVKPPLCVLQDQYGSFGVNLHPSRRVSFLDLSQTAVHSCSPCAEHLYLSIKFTDLSLSSHRDIEIIKSGLQNIASMVKARLANSSAARLSTLVIPSSLDSVVHIETVAVSKAVLELFRSGTVLHEDETMASDSAIPRVLVEHQARNGL
ncbi:hypothetical protein JCM8097_002465 [Rhodosporidiobolus ruineniae]